MLQVGDIFVEVRGWVSMPPDPFEDIYVDGGNQRP
jgi:hypothetical protein